MAIVPKRKHSQARRDKRRSNVWKLEAPTLVKCPQCCCAVLIVKVYAPSAARRRRQGVPANRQTMLPL